MSDSTLDSTPDDDAQRRTNPAEGAYERESAGARHMPCDVVDRHLLLVDLPLGRRTGLHVEALRRLDEGRLIPDAGGRGASAARRSLHRWATALRGRRGAGGKRKSPLRRKYFTRSAAETSARLHPASRSRPDGSIASVRKYGVEPDRPAAPRTRGAAVAWGRAATPSRRARAGSGRHACPRAARSARGHEPRHPAAANHGGR
jgi:hypothetical protein